MRSVVKVSKTINDAVEEALMELNIGREDVDVEVMEEPKKGLFGILGSKDAVVRVTVTYDPKEVIDVFITKILYEMGLSSGTTRVEIKDNIAYVDIENIDEEQMGIVIGRRGATLDSIQYLMSLVLNKKKDKYYRVILDINDYRKKREETLERLAYKMAEKAKKSKRVIKLEPMNPYERRIIHSSLQSLDYITTHSEGEEPYRRVVIKLK